MPLLLMLIPSAYERMIYLRVVGLVSTREADSVGRASVRSGSSDVDLGTFHVELGSVWRVCAVKGNQLDSHEIIPGGNASWHGEIVPSSLSNHVVNCPL